MSPLAEALDSPSRVASQRTLAHLAWSLVLLPPLVYAWRQSHFQYDVYLPPHYGALGYQLAVAVIVMVAAVGWYRGYPRPLVRITVGFVLLAAMHAILDQLITTDNRLFVFVEAIVFALIMLPIISEKHLLLRFVRLNFALGLTLIALNTVPVLHWLGIVSLPHRQVRRFGGEAGLFQLDPLHFGIFGLTENYAYPGHPLGIARLQGFSLEPIHWSYFVFLTLACGLFLLSRQPSARQRLGFSLAFVLIGVHLFFVFSSVVFITIITLAGLLSFVALMRRFPAWRKRERLYSLIVVVLTPGILIPFLISRIPNLDTVLVAENVLNEGANWESKIGFLSLGRSLYTRFLPATGDIPAAGHNLVLSTYLKYGYFLVLPLLLFLLAILRRAFAGRSFPMVAGTSVSLLAHTIAVPTLLFYPSGAMWLLMAAGMAFHASEEDTSGLRVSPPLLQPRPLAHAR